MSKVRFGIIGIGNMGSGHAKILTEGSIKGAVLTAVCDGFEKQRQWARENLKDVAVFEYSASMIDSGYSRCRNRRNSAL